MPKETVRERVDAFIRDEGLVPPGGDVTVLVSGGAGRPLLCVWGVETRRYCESEGLHFREDTSNADTVRGLIREQVLPLLRRIHPAADANLLRALETRETMPPALAELLAATPGS